MEATFGNFGQTVAGALGQLQTQQLKTQLDLVSGARREEVRKAAEDFEAVFLTQMLQHMFSGVEVDELFGGGHAEETFRTLLMDEYGKSISRAGGIGIAEQVERELLKLQEV